MSKDATADGALFRHAKEAQRIEIHLSPIADLPDFALETAFGTGQEDMAIGFNITELSLTDMDGSESLSLELYSEDSNLKGVFMGDAQITAMSSAASGSTYDLTPYFENQTLSITSKQHFEGNVSFVLKATSTEESLVKSMNVSDSNNMTASSSIEALAHFRSLPDMPLLRVLAAASNYEDHAIRCVCLCVCVDLYLETPWPMWRVRVCVCVCVWVWVRVRA